MQFVTRAGQSAIFVFCSLLVMATCSGVALGGTAYGSWVQHSNAYANASGQSSISTAQKNAFAYSNVRANAYAPTGYIGAQGVAYKNGSVSQKGGWVINQSPMSANSTITAFAATGTPVGTSATVYSYGNMELYNGSPSQYTIFSLTPSPSQTI
ncbi:MAG: hypothetical protein HFJ75_04970 [Eggerthellaceae bacterium]|nr:hypothetical protein [Eggerthellaceae bacterium]